MKRSKPLNTNIATNDTLAETGKRLIVQNNSTKQRFNWLHHSSTCPSTKSDLSQLHRRRFAEKIYSMLYPIN